MGRNRSRIVTVTLLMSGAATCVDQDLLARRGVTVTGMVRSRTTRAPVGAAYLSAWHAGGGVGFPATGTVLGAASTDSTGHYRLGVGAPPGYAGANCAVTALTVAASGYQQAVLTLSDIVTDCNGGGHQASAQDILLDPSSSSP